MKRKLLALLVPTMAVLATVVRPAFADSLTYGPYAGSGAAGAPGTTPPDSCALANPPTTTNWAVELYNLSFTVNTVPDSQGRFHVTARYKQAHFSTLGGDSPGKCDSSLDHGSAVTEGVTGSFTGNQHLKVTPGVGGFDPTGSCERNTSQICTVNGFVRGFFGDDATYTAFYYRFHYTAK